MSDSTAVCCNIVAWKDACRCHIINWMWQLGFHCSTFYDPEKVSFSFKDMSLIIDDPSFFEPFPSKRYLLTEYFTFVFLFLFEKKTRKELSSHISWCQLLLLFLSSLSIIIHSFLHSDSFFLIKLTTSEYVRSNHLFVY